MALDKLNQLYRQVILDHAQSPHHHGHLAAPTQKIELRNPTCGDVLQVEIQVSADKIDQIAFSGEGCTISQASASMMTDTVLHLSLNTADERVGLFSEMLVAAQTPSDLDQLGDAAILSDVKRFPARIKCATLAWKALHQLIVQAQSQQEAKDD